MVIMIGFRLGLHLDIKTFTNFWISISPSAVRSTCDIKESHSCRLYGLSPIVVMYFLSSSEST